MSMTVTEAQPEQPIALYIDLEKNQKADLETIAQASIAFVHALRAAARELDPTLNIRVELIDSSEGSLSLNSTIKAITGLGGVDRKTLRILALLAAGWFGGHVADWTFDKAADLALEKLTGKSTVAEKQSVALSDAQVDQIANAVARAQKSPEVQKSVAQVYRSLSKDAAVRGVGLNISDLRLPPEYIVPKAEFETRLLDASEIQQIESTRERSITEVVRLVTAVLDPVSRRKWVIETSHGVRSASMDDTKFKQLLVDGKITTKLNSNIRLDAVLKISERQIDGRWKLVGISIQHVNRLVLPGSSEDLSVRD